MSQKACPQCQSPVLPNTKFCPECGARMNPTCNCGYTLTGTEKFCPNCGSQTTNTQTAQTSGQQTPSPGNYNPFVSNIKSPGQSPGTSSPLPGATPVHQQTPIGQVPDIPEGEVLLEQFRIKQKLGTGGCGTVYRAEHTTLGEDRALKVIGGFDIADEMLKVFVSEYKAQLQIKDRSHILWSESPLRCTHGGMQWILLPMELGEKTLRDWLRETKNDLEGRLQQGLEYFKQACRGVEALHKEGLLHLDIKPENILLVREQGSDKLTAKIGDFGLTRGLGKALENRPDLLADGVGTPAYMAPEQILAARWKDVGKEADIYGLGMILYELIDGDLPYSGTAQQIREKKINPQIEITPLTTHPEISKVAMGCLERDKKKRIGSVREILLQIDEKMRKEEEIRRNRTKVLDLLERANELFDEKEYENVLEVLEEAEELDSDNSDVQSLKEKAKSEIRRKRREPEIKNLMSKVEYLIRIRHYEEAQICLENILQLDFNNIKARSLKKSVDEKINRIIIEKGENKIQEFLLESRKLIRIRNYEEALVVLNKAWKLDPTNIEIKILINSVEEKIMRIINEKKWR